MAKKKVNKIRVTKVKSTINRPKDQKATMIALGLRKMNQSNEYDASPALLGMVHKVQHLVKVEEL
jgi:large subunit ribosomal protein L30